ncbi:MAG: GAF domain-containing protein [Akkermansiaceae bacterium]|nr:GAF domain-containing protein [Akkermansiaceae bacterium]NNM29369.1 GAF domain-containing protein [Akkermansiaceae bacterium]
MNSSNLPPAEWARAGLIDDITGGLTRELLARSGRHVGAHNTALWLAASEHLDPVLGTGPHAEHFVGHFLQPLNQGIVSYVYASGQNICENAISSNPQHSSLLDSQLGITTDAMIAVPVVTNGEICGVITCVHTRPAGSGEEPKEFRPADLEEFDFAAACIGRLLEAALHQQS